MKLWPWKRNISRIDPVFGPIVWGRAGGSWKGSVRLPNQATVGVRIFSDKLGPIDIQRQKFAEFLHKFDDLRAIMAGPMMRAYNEHILSWAEQDPSLKSRYPALTDPQQIWQIATLYTVEINVPRHPEFCLDHSVEWMDPDHGLNVTINGWQVEDVDVE